MLNITIDLERRKLEDRFAIKDATIDIGIPIHLNKQMLVDIQKYVNHTYQDREAFLLHAVIEIQYKLTFQNSYAHNSQDVSIVDIQDYSLSSLLDKPVHLGSY